VNETAGLVLAAGAGRRFGTPKAPVVVDGERLVDRAVRVLREGGCRPVLVVLGAWIGGVPDAEVIVNDDWQSGMASSLRIGLTEMAQLTDAQRALVTLVDLPGLTAAAVERLAASSDDLAVATYSGDRGHPVLMSREHWASVAESVSGDQGARRYLQSHSVSLVEVGDVASGADLDEP
jgi:CTP:molybdopterin cytidylyltransferase MocA